MAKLGTIAFTGKSGAKYDFNVYPWDTNFKEGLSAVYFVTRRTEESDGYFHTSIYVGQTDDLSTRLNNHHKQACFDKYNKNSICVYGEEDEDTRLEIEKDLIDNYSPPCNGN